MRLPFLKRGLRLTSLLGFTTGLFASLVGLLLVASFVMSGLAIGRSVRAACAAAVARVAGDDCVPALEQLIADEAAGFEERNGAVWALGQLGDRRAVPFLDSLRDNGTDPDGKTRNSSLSQYEIYKAIRLLESGINLTAIVWR